MLTVQLQKDDPQPGWTAIDDLSFAERCSFTTTRGHEQYFHALAKRKGYYIEARPPNTRRIHHQYKRAKIRTTSRSKDMIRQTSIISSHRKYQNTGCTNFLATPCSWYKGYIHMIEQKTPPPSHPVHSREGASRCCPSLGRIRVDTTSFSDLSLSCGGVARPSVYQTLVRCMALLSPAAGVFLYPRALICKRTDRLIAFSYLPHTQLHLQACCTSSSASS